jgi:hypothetical protein
MTIGQPRFRQRELRRAIRALAAEGLTVTRVEIDQAGKLTIFTAGAGARMVKGSELDDWLASHARPS